MVKKRELKGIQLLAETGNVKQVDPSNFLVRSKTDPDTWYEVKWQKVHWTCACVDYSKRGKKCKHIYAVVYYLAIGGISRTAKNSTDEHKCPICGLDDLVVKSGVRYNRSGPAQRYYCQRCDVRFVSRNAFARMRNSAAVIATALDLYFRGLSLRKISEHLWACHGIRATHATIHSWIKRYVDLVSQYVEGLTAKTSGRWHADETLVRVNGRHMVLWGLLDSETRLLIAKRCCR